jgi:DENN (AEX-3) domain
MEGGGDSSSRFSVASTQTRWKNLVSAVAAVVDPTLPSSVVTAVTSISPVPPLNTEEEAKEVVAFEKEEEKDDAIAAETLEKEEKNEESSVASMVKCSPNETTKDDAAMDDAANTVPPIATESTQYNASLFPRLQTWRKQAAVALEERTALTSRWTTSFATSVSSNLSMDAAKEDATSQFITMKDDEGEGDGNDHAAGTGESIPSETDDSAQEETATVEDDPTVGSTAATAESNTARRSWGAMVDSVAIPAHVFRGRYTSVSALTTASIVATPPSPAPTTQTQATRIGKLSATAEHWNQLTAHLQPHEYILLLGRGMLGVNLKQCYRLHAGVYTDFLVPQGSAERSGLVYIGDVIVSVGATDCRKGTIATIPGLIAQSARPVHITMATSGAHPGHHVQYIDIAVAILHGCAQPTLAATDVPSVDPHTVERPRTPSTGGSIDDAAIEERDGETQMSLIQATSFDAIPAMPTDCRIPDVVFEKDEEWDGVWHPTHPTPAIVDAYAAHVAQRNLPTFTTDFMDAACLTHSHLRHALRQSLVLVVADRRRLVFFQRFLHRTATDRGADEESPPSTDWMALLTLYVELYDFVEYYEMMSVAKRREYAQAIAHKYFLPTVLAPGHPFQTPEFDFHTIVADSSLRRLEATLTTTPIPRNVFRDFQSAAFDALTEDPFRAFFVSSDCARMRAFLRNTAPYVPISMAVVGEAWKVKENTDDAVSTNNYLLYCLVHLFCLMEQDEVGENDDVVVAATTTEGSADRGLRMEHAASGLCASLWIRRKLLPAVLERSESVTTRIEQLWEIFLAPGVGSLFEGTDPSPAVRCLHELRLVVQDVPRALDPERRFEWLSIVSEKAEALAQELLLDYAVHLHPKFRLHKFHEWLCEELAEAGGVQNGRPKLNPGSLKRLLRRTKFPVGITPHQPAHDRVSILDNSTAESATNGEQHCNADCAIVFGTRVDQEVAVDSFDGLPPNLCRYTCQSVATGSSSDCRPSAMLTPEEVPPTLESYAFTPPTRTKPFSAAAQEHWRSADGWEVSLVHFEIPRTDASDSENASLYGVSLMFHHNRMESNALCADDDTIKMVLRSEPVLQTQSPLQVDESGTGNSSSSRRIVRISAELPKYQKELEKNSSWCRRQSNSFTADSKQCISIGLALVSQQNHILAMRETLSLLLQDFLLDGNRAAPLVNVLGAFADAADKEFESNSLQVLLETYLTRASTPWLERPVGAQRDAFLQKAGHELIQCLPPIPLALMFVTALLEQKIVLTSNRRSVLVSATMALTELLHPLRWCHLILSRVPPALAADVLQYPAPFILGLPSNDPGIVDLLRDLPEDVTLVDLDVGRVILAPSLGHDRDFGRRARSTDATEVARILRSQMLHLAQSLGSVVGAHLDPSTWCSDHPLGHVAKTEVSGSPFDRLREVCGDFMTELLAGTASCCYWLEEAGLVPEKDGNSSVATVVFDEDQFFHIKQGRHRHGFRSLFGDNAPKSSLALSLNEFDLVLELLLRCQSMNAYIGTRERSEMAFSSLETCD